MFRSSLAWKTSPATAVILFLLLPAAVPAIAEIIPAGRIAPWQGNVGVPGGIPNRTTTYKNIVTDLGADPTGAKDCSEIIQRAIDDCPKDQVIYIPEGTFLVTTIVYLAQKSNVTLRGAGQGRTTIKTNNKISSAFRFGATSDAVTPVAVVSGARRGSNAITVADAADFAVDGPLWIGPNTLPTWAHNLGGFPDTLRSMKVGFKIRSKTKESLTLRSKPQWHKQKEQATTKKRPDTDHFRAGPTTIMFDPPLPYDFSGMSPVASWVRAYPYGFPFIQGVGVESLTFDLSHGQQFCAVQFYQAWGCWLKDVEIKGAYSRQAYFEGCVRCEVRGCYTHDVQSTGPNHEGLDFNQSHWCLVEDNICNGGGAPSIIFGDGLGGNACNVIGYNYSLNTAQTGFWDISFNHGAHNMLNLTEGNAIDNYKDDGYFGSSSHNTLFRNRIRGQLALKHFSNYYNIVGNVLGTTDWVSGSSAVYEADQANYWNSHIFPIYELGYPNIGNVSYTGIFGPTDPPDYSDLPNTLDGCQQLDRNVKATILRHGNWDAANKRVVWDSSITDHTIPNSMYYSSEPAWWPVGVSWPPIGSDLKPMVSRIPAEVRFLAKGSQPPKHGTPPRP